MATTDRSYVLDPEKINCYQEFLVIEQEKKAKSPSGNIITTTVLHAQPLFPSNGVINLDQSVTIYQAKDLSVSLPC